MYQHAYIIIITVTKYYIKYMFGHVELPLTVNVHNNYW